MHRQADDAQRGRMFDTADAKEGGEHLKQEKDWKSRRLGGKLGIGFFAGPDEEQERPRRRCLLRKRQREKEETIACRKSTCL